MDLENVNSAWLKFKELFLSVVNELAPLKQIRIKQRSEPWFSGIILDLISRRDHALANFRKSKSSELFDLKSTNS